MNKIILLIAFVFAGSFVSAQKLTLNGLTDDSLDYGTITKNADGLRKIEVKNTGKKPLIITNVTSSCGCTVPDWTKTPIAPKKTGFINVKYNTGIVGSILKSITVSSNDPEVPNKMIKIKGTVLDSEKTTASAQ